MSNPIELPGDIVVNPPPTPGALVTPPPAPGVVMLPVQGPTGPQGPPGDTAQTLAFTYTTSTPATLHQIHHGLAFKPAGVVCHDADGSTLLGFAVSHPMVGVTEVAFGVPVTPTIYLS